MEIDADDLWAVEPSSFVAARDALAKRLRAEGDRQAATEVKKRKRPPVSAWALNAVARAQPDLVDTVLTAGAALEAALTGGSGDRAARGEAQQAERQATDALVVDAAARIDGTGQQVTEAIRSRIVQTIRASQLDPEVAERLRSGTLADDETPTVFGIVSSAPSPPREPREPRPAKRRAKLPSRGRTVPQTDAAGEAAAPDEDTTEARPAPKAAPAKKSAEDKAAERAAEKAAREEARAARVALAHQQEEARRLAKRADRLEERARELAADARAAADEATQARGDADRAAAALADAEASADPDD